MKYVVVFYFIVFVENVWSNNLHPDIVAPEIEASRIELLKQIEHHEQLRKSVGPDGFVFSFDPFGQSPSQFTIPNSAEEFRFWEISDDETLGIFLEQLAFQIDMTEYRNSAVFRTLPLGYGVVRYVVRFEIHLRFSGWYALENVGPEEMEVVISYYKKAGFTEEAIAVEKAQQAWIKAVDHGHDEYEAVRNAYNSVVNPYKESDVRWARIIELSRDRAWWEGN